MGQSCSFFSGEVTFGVINRGRAKTEDWIGSEGVDGECRSVRVDCCNGGFRVGLEIFFYNFVESLVESCLFISGRIRFNGNVMAWMVRFIAEGKELGGQDL